MDIKIYTDGACLGNPGPGGWGYLIKMGNDTIIQSGGKAITTNNEMELSAVIEALKSLHTYHNGIKFNIELYSDSKYVTDGIKSWLSNWMRKGWRTSSGGAVANINLWKEYVRFSQNHTIQTFWVKGHSGHPENERCDQLASKQAKMFKSIS